jgi:hypothetical protein
MSQDERLVAVRKVADEATATMLCDFLRDNGIPAAPVAKQIPWLPGVETFHRGYWGEVEVMESDADKARLLIQDFYAAEPQSEPGDAEPEDDGDEDDDGDDDGPGGRGGNGPDTTPAA